MTDRTEHAISLLRTIIIRNDRYYTIIQSEDWHEDKTLQFKVDAEYRCRSCRE